MKKLLAGCLIAAALGIAALGGGAYVLYRAASPLIEDARSYVQGLSQLSDIDRQLANTSTYTPPVTGELNAAQVQRFVRVQQHVRSQLGQRMKEIETRYAHLRNSAAPSAQVTFTELLGSLRDMTGVVLDARRFQVEALNAEGFSQDEYAWVRERMLQAAGVELGSRVDLQKLEEAIRTGTGIEAIRTDRIPLPDAPARNRELIKPYLGQMDEWLPLIFFGL